MLFGVHHFATRRDCCRILKMKVILLINFKCFRILLKKTSKYLIVMDSESDADLPSKTSLVKYLEEKNFSELPVQSRICIFHGILAVFDIRELTANVADEKTFLVDVAGCQLLDLLPMYGISLRSKYIVSSHTFVATIAAI